MSEVKRGIKSSGRDAEPGRPPKVQPVDELRQQTAQERIDEIELLQFKGNGFIVPRPEELTIETFRQWMRDTAAIGSGDHVAIVWQYGNQSMAWRDKLLNEYHMLCRQAGQRWGELQDAARAEKHAADAEYQKRKAVTDKQRAVAQARAKLAALEAQ